jgi:hypothetical protein
MRDAKRVTVYFEPNIHRALRLRAAEGDQSISTMVNNAVRQVLAEDAEDIAAFEKRKKEPTVDYATLVKSLKRRGKI